MKFPEISEVKGNPEDMVHWGPSAIGSLKTRYIRCRNTYWKYKTRKTPGLDNLTSKRFMNGKEDFIVEFFQLIQKNMGGEDDTRGNDYE